MSRSFFVDIVIACAMCMVVWGSVPILLAQTGPPFYEEGNLPGDAITDANSCCYLFGDSKPCIGANNPNTGLCTRKPSCNYSWQWWSCKCGSLAHLRSAGPPKKYFVSCGCGG